MKRDMELIRKILIEFEELPLNHKVDKFVIEGYSYDKIIYNTFLLEEAGLVEIIDTSDDDGKDFLPVKLIWKGHEFLDNIKNDNVWNSIKSLISSKGGNVAFSILKLVAEEKAKEIFGIQ